MSLELLLKENQGKVLEFGVWYIKGHHLFYKPDTTIHSITSMLGTEEITFFMNNGLTFEAKMDNDRIVFSAMSVHGKSIWVSYLPTEYHWK